MILHIVVEERTDANLLRRVLTTAATPDVQMWDAGGARVSAITLAQSVRAVRQQPVLLVLDARTVDVSSIEDQEITVSELFGPAAPPIQGKVAFAVPELEVVLFHDPAVLERVLGVQIPERARIEARFIPKKVLAELMAASGRFADEGELIAALDDDAARRIAAHPLIQQLERLVADMRAEPVPAEYRLRRTG